MEQEEGVVRTIVHYSTRSRAKNDYPRQIISPPTPSSCCSKNMESLGRPRTEGEWRYIYLRCRRCGFTVRHFLTRFSSLPPMEEGPRSSKTSHRTPRVRRPSTRRSHSHRAPRTSASRTRS